MKKLLLLAAVAAGVVVIARSKSDQLKGAAAKVTGDPRVQSALATATEKAAPVVSQVQQKAAPVVSQVGDKVGSAASAATAASSYAADRLGRSGEPETGNLESVPPEAVDEVAGEDPVSAPDFEAEGTAAPAGDAGAGEPEFTGFEPPVVESADVEPAADPLTDPLPTEPGDPTDPTAS